MPCPPILFLVFNRPRLTKAAFERIRVAKPRQLFIAADGPRVGRAGEEKLCFDTRRLLADVDWDCDVHRLYRGANLGCATAVSSAITWFFEHVEAGIILEDDCVASSSFFSFCECLLERYRSFEQVKAISGSGFVPGLLAGKDDYYFTKYPLVWGWATWRRAWEDYSLSLIDESDAEIQTVLKSYGSSKEERAFWFDILRTIRDAPPTTWDYQLYYSVWKRGGVAISPRVNLVENVGFGEDATHTRLGKCPQAHDLHLERHPRKVARNRRAELYLAKHNYLIPAFGFYHRCRFAIGKVRRLLLRRLDK